MRGKDFTGQNSLLVPRITPAGAGKSYVQSRHKLMYQDHPRRCGEKFSGQLDAASGTGSPPQVRGKAGGGGGLSVTIRITPAGAGKRLVFIGITNINMLKKIYFAYSLLLNNNY